MASSVAVSGGAGVVTGCGPAQQGRGLRRLCAVLALVAVVIVGLSGCSVFRSLFGSREADITGFVVDHMIGAPTIDAVAHTVTAEVEPLDVSALMPTITVSEKAAAGAVALVDGEPVPVQVTAENGDIVDWLVTVSAGLGIALELTGSRVLLLHGVEDSSDAANHEDIGSGRPLGTLGSTTGTTYLAAYAEAFGYTSGADHPVGGALVQLAGGSAGTYRYGDVWFAYSDSLSVGGSTGRTLSGGAVKMTVDRYEAVGGVISGSFSGIVDERVDGVPTGIQDISGYLKVVRIRDNVLGAQ